ncbi:MAG: uroporphyrinogen-III C-methyltransferase [Polaromonas sp.]|uniref:uroporphyrinogen-III C-methyltransferase n=1 Tax=Polaromonas sp. TaxID=1869339 RepID=UPI00272FE649|nr:uroporphyrinogen-III C-methyltransferase [Polaromonas sp.]MDP2450071.1 uroporphyrinogen-III C-methyltransferase [Polaromonas sp.]MDP3247554.1 uroporphyrinogen-III C-methyltransferase [Polaromonas sp.]MDP3755349.1 uroporphyrinogen-III C-methyltransferase [Polaromonas sp.]
MSDSEPVPTPLSAPLAELPAAPAAAGAWRRWLLATGLVAIAGLVLGILLWQKLGNIQEELARRSTDATAQSIEARTLARQAQESTRELTARLALLETRLSEVSLQRTQLEELMQSLSRSRDENLVVDVESALRLAQQQAQLTGSAEPLLAALKSADQRLARAAQPRLNPLQRAIARDVERIKATTVTDVPGLLLKLDELTRMVDDLPLANAMVTGAAAARLVASAPAAAPAPVRPASAAGTSMAWLDSLALRAWWQRTLQGTLDEARGLLRVSRIDQPDAVLLAPEQAFFLRENLKLKLLNARLGLLSRQTASARSDLAAAGASLAKYFDPASRRTQAATQLLLQVQSQMKSSELPRLDETLAALATAAAGR